MYRIYREYIERSFEGISVRLVKKCVDEARCAGSYLYSEVLERLGLKGSWFEASPGTKLVRSYVNNDITPGDAQL
jgi:hypothetical protein